MGWLLAYMLIGTAISEVTHWANVWVASRGSYPLQGRAGLYGWQWIILAWTYPAFLLALIVVPLFKKRSTK